MKKVARYRIRRNNSRILQLINDLFISLPHAVCFYVVYFLYFEVLERFLGGQLNPWMTRGIRYSGVALPAGLDHSPGVDDCRGLPADAARQKGIGCCTRM
jgi:hypothetical protein